MENERKGFTLLELLAVLVILAVIATIAIPIFTNNNITAKQVAHNKTVQTLLGQAYAYLLTKDSVTASNDIMDELISDGFIKERPTYPLGEDNYIVKIDGKGIVTVIPGMVEVTGVKSGNSGGGGEGQEESEEEDEPEPPAGEQTTVLNDEDGDGYKDIWYLEQLAYINTNTTTLADDYELMRSLDFDDDGSYLNLENKTLWSEEGDGEGWTPIGGDDFAIAFKGDFNGNNYKIKNLYINDGAKFYLGLFGTTQGGIISNLNLENSTIKSTIDNICCVGGLVSCELLTTIDNCYLRGTMTVSFINEPELGSFHTVGGLAGMHQFGTISNCHNIGTINVEGEMQEGIIIGGISGYKGEGTIVNCNSTANIENHYAVGGITGYQMGGTINKCKSTGNIAGDSYIGGLVGFANYGTISNSYSTGNVTGTGYNIGGLVGSIGDGLNNSEIINSYATGNVTGDNLIGGAVGSFSFDKVTMSNCYSTGNVVGNSEVGGIIGYKSGSSLSNCYRLDTATVNENPTDGSNPLDGMNRTQAELRSEEFIYEVLNWEEEIWQAVENGWPELK